MRKRVRVIPLEKLLDPPPLWRRVSTMLRIRQPAPEIPPGRGSIVYHSFPRRKRMRGRMLPGVLPGFIGGVIISIIVGSIILCIHFLL